MHDSLPITDNCDLCVEVRHHQKGSRFTNGNGVSNALAKAGIELGENGSIFPRPAPTEAAAFLLLCRHDGRHFGSNDNLAPTTLKDNLGPTTLKCSGKT